MPTAARVVAVRLFPVLLATFSATAQSYTWNAASPLIEPSARRRPAMAWDESLQVAMLFGGDNTNNDT